MAPQTDRRADRRLDPWLDLVRDAVLHAGPFPDRLIREQLHREFGSYVVGGWSDGADVAIDEAVPTWPVAQVEEHWRHGGWRRHPLPRWYTVAPDLTPMTIERVPTWLVTERDRDELREALVPPEVQQQMSIMHFREGMRRRAFTLGRAGTDFSDGEVAFARQLQPLLALLDRQAQVLAEVDSETLAGELGVSGRQLAVLELLDEGLTAEAIGRRLGISPRTVQVHLRHVYRALDVHDRLLAVRIYRDVRRRLSGRDVRNPA
ncbi:response regulator transcription factor [Nocardioides caldifontis]|uniref:response regulator transcription factor n=1 Tax=Nocardioides caldifontis TaxID=2588938 RepID=UPI0011DFA40B|nr:helix-turn-helix transcriptional regulator [Nocardioides caldifontis]